MTHIGSAYRCLRAALRATLRFDASLAASVAVPMVRRMPFFPIVAIALLLSAAPAVQAAQKYPVFGLVLKINAPREFVVSCKDIPGFMDAKVMTMPVRDPQYLKAIRPGMLVDFTLVVDSGSSY